MNRHSTLLTIASVTALLIFTGADDANSQSQAPTAAPIASASTANENWSVDDTHSMCLFRVHHSGAGMFWGRFDKVSGTITTTGAGPDSISFDIAVQTESVSSGNPKLDKHLMSPDFFSVKEFPTMTFKSTSAKRESSGMWSVNGDLTIHGVTKPIIATIELTGRAGKEREKIGFEAMFVVDRSQFGMNYGVEQGALGKDIRVIVGLEAAKGSGKQDAGK